MAALPIISVLTPTWQRHDLLLQRCIPAVDAQSYPALEHVIVSDGPDPGLLAWFQRPPEGRVRRSYLELDEHEEARHWGHAARLKAIDYSFGDLITYCDDDDALRPGHCFLLAAALEAHPEAGFALSRMACHDQWNRENVIGEGPPSLRNVGTPMIMHRREVLGHGTWGPASPCEDWDLVNRWLQEDVPYVQVDQVTADQWPSAYFAGRR